jgi:hypothetical protein
MTIQLEWWQWVLPLVVACVIMGLYQGWRVMAVWTVGVYFSALVASALGPKLDLFVNKFLSVIGQFFAIAADQPEGSIETPKIEIASPWEPLATAGLFAGCVILSWWIARKLAAREGIGLLGHLIGGAFGAIAAILAMSAAFDYWSDYVERSGNPTAGGQVTVPQISIGVAALPDSNPLMGLAGMALGLFLLIIIVYTIWRAVRAAL